MAIGFGVLGLEPKAFWAMTPKELEAAIRGRVGPAWADAPPSKDDVAALMSRFPDR
jgi:uncharacterized phage protein (TIGR02216 family)